MAHKVAHFLNHDAKSHEKEVAKSAADHMQSLIQNFKELNLLASSGVLKNPIPQHEGVFRHIFHSAEKIIKAIFSFKLVRRITYFLVLRKLHKILKFKKLFDSHSKSLLEIAHGLLKVFDKGWTATPESSNTLLKTVATGSWELIKNKLKKLASG